MKKFHIFSGGVINDTSFIKISADDCVICADRGIVYASELGISPDIIVGDFDSYSGELPENAKIIRSVPEKDDTDTLMAVREAIRLGAEEIRIYGAFGGRFDHEFANIQTLEFARKQRCRAILEDSDNIVMLQDKGERHYKKKDGWYFSVFAYTAEVHVRCLSGVKYPLENAVLTNNFPIGVSNEIISEEAVLDISDGTALVIFSERK